MNARINTRKTSTFVYGAPSDGKHLAGEGSAVRNRCDGRVSGTRTGGIVISADLHHAALIVEQLDPSRSYCGGSAGKDRISGEALPAGVTGIVPRYTPAT